MAHAMLPSTIAASFPSELAPNEQCPNCLSRGMLHFYALEGIPAHSCLLMPTRQEALRYPRRDLRLGFCPSCSFIGNTLFDTGVHEYSQRYEETQGFSPTFNQFARGLAQQLVERHQLRSKTILEIGCGKGEFLLLLCELGDNHGIGIDPSYVPSRTTSPAAARVQFHNELYSAKHRALHADMIVCRHTLEHIPNTWEFLTTLRQTLGERRDTIVFFELPDAFRVLREGAFWDIYYEHCTYFSAGSLARLFRAAGFQITDLEMVYDGQYILITAQPAAGPTQPHFVLELDRPRVAAAIAAFRDSCQKRIRHWRQHLDDNAAAGKRTVIWGSGSKGVALLTTLRITSQVEYVVDINPYRQGKYMPGAGHAIVAPEFLQQYHPDEVIVMNPVYVPEIQRQLEQLGVAASVLAI